MAIRGNIVIKGLTVPNAYARIKRLFGGKHDLVQAGNGRYAALIHLYPSRALAVEDNKLAEYSVDIPYVEGDPYPKLYAALKAYRPIIGLDDHGQPKYGEPVFANFVDDLE